MIRSTTVQPLARIAERRASWSWGALLVACLLLVVGAERAEARAYQWRSPTTGTLQMSGTPPAWYRGSAGGPRVWVYEAGQLIDDTAIEVMPDQAERLREVAFAEFEERQRAEALKRLERTALRQELREQAATRERSRVGPGADRRDAAEPQPEASDTAPPGGLDDGMIDRLKALIRDFDRQGGELLR